MEKFPEDARSEAEPASATASNIGAFDQAMMRRCLTLARRALGQTAPNPLVGAVVVRDGRIVGEGFHPGAGQPHAEVFALEAAGELAKGATVYVNLEPCNHYGRTPPCSEALIRAEVGKVIVGMVDPNPQVDRGGIARLIEAGIETVVGVEEQACRELNEAFIHRIRHRRPFGILKYAMTLDGKIATNTGHSAWVSSSQARQFVHQLRSACDAVVVGGNTVRQDNPRLTSRESRARNPLRVVMTRTLDLPQEAQLWQTEEAATLVLTETGTRPDFQESLTKQGVEVVELSPLTPARAMAYLYDRELLSVLWECGGTLAAPAIAQGCIQKAIAVIAPKIIGGQSAPSPVGELGLTAMTDAVSLERIRWRAIGSDLAVEGYIRSEMEDEGMSR
jgi:diaminohydroxyphosphoribosylaminopyrimidine deaminase/5-amino-6-(5-phosphoribosylamino)uracil reductase